MSNSDSKQLPLRHVAIIMDGNGRWAKKRGFIRSQGHIAGGLAIEKIIEYVHKLKLEVITFYAFSTENWSRPKEEIKGLLKLLDKYLDKFIKKFTREDSDLYRYSRINFVGDLSVFPDIIREKIVKAENFNLSRPEIHTTVNIAINYGGKAEIVQAVNKYIKENPGKSISEKDIESNLYFAGQPDPDLIIRTGNEMRLSNFLMWESAYSEFYSTETLWPDFNEKSFDAAIDEYKNRTRRFGAL